MPAKKKSYRQIARELDLSPSTISRIASGTGRYSDDTKDAVTRALLQEGYVIDAPSVPVICAVVADLNNEIYNNVLSALSRYLSRKGYVLQIYVENKDQTELIHRLSQSNAEGLFLVGTPLSQIALEASFPAVQILSHSQVSWKNQIYSVLSDEFVGGRLAARALLEKGCRHPVILNNRHTSSQASPRIIGFKEEWSKAGGDLSSIYIHDGEPYKSAFHSAHDIISYLTARGSEFDCIFACSDWRAYGALVALQAMKVSIPDTVRLIGFDGERVSRYCALPFTTILQDTQMLASSATELLLSLVDGKTPAEPSIVVPVQIQRGMTV